MIETLKERFDKNMNRHPDIAWDQIEARLRENPEVLEKLRKMEETGGQPDVIGIDENGMFVFCDCSPETPAGRRSLCYDDKALGKRTKNPPASSAMHQANEMGIELLDEELYKGLQQLGQFDLKTSSWIATPEEFRKLGGALFAEKRYGRVFFFHNGADSYYSVRGWRGYVCL